MIFANLLAPDSADLSDYLMISSPNWIVGICAGTVLSLSLSQQAL
jgi:hypothetical protein